MIKHYFSKIIKLNEEMHHKNYTTLAGSITFFAIMNGGSIIFLILFIISKMNINEGIDNQIINLNYSMGGYYSIFFILSSIYSSSSLFLHIIKAKEIIYDIKYKSKMIGRLFSVILVVILLLSSIALFIGIFFLEYLASWINIPFIMKIIKYPSYFFALLGLIIFINVYVSPIKISFKKVLNGSIFTCLFGYIATILFVTYLKYFSNFKQIYGALTFFIVFMFWIYLLTIGLVIGFFIIKPQIDTTNLETFFNNNEGGESYKNN